MRGLLDCFPRNGPFLVEEVEVSTASAENDARRIRLGLSRSFDGGDALWHCYLPHRVHADATGKQNHPHHHRPKSATSDVSPP
ncbi:hypothetical protein SAY87_001738 [Trapa incisa]|uniref:Uncharacterized protein n=1 Tax=Trapa incisa TaxID=236973 RepID=A0AAN7PTP2_9MYRT|nr:hypothetical protein SAY87_001738 [Trapa incisa]